jgi:hypothetical protein
MGTTGCHYFQRRYENTNSVESAKMCAADIGKNIFLCGTEKALVG